MTHAISERKFTREVNCGSLVEIVLKPEFQFVHTPELHRAHVADAEPEEATANRLVIGVYEGFSAHYSPTNDPSLRIGGWINPGEDPKAKYDYLLSESHIEEFKVLERAR